MTTRLATTMTERIVSQAILALSKARVWLALVGWKTLVEFCGAAGACGMRTPSFLACSIFPGLVEALYLTFPPISKTSLYREW